MTGNPELVMVALVIIIMVLVFAVVWFFFMVPMEKGLHRRRMELIQKRLRQNEERLKRAQHGTTGRKERGDGDEICG